MVYTVPPDVIQKQFPEFTVVNALTPSAQKCAYHVKDKNGNDFCLKLIAPNYGMDRLNREIKAMLEVDHPNLVKLVEYTFSSKPNDLRHFIIEEFIEGQDLTHRLGSPWASELAVKVFGGLLDGLEELNKIRVVHRDIKPGNIRIRPNDEPVLIDFGLARHLELSDITKTSDGARIGTPLYFSPEQFTGNKHDIDNRTDLFAVGILLYEALVGQHPFYSKGMDYTQFQEAVCTSEEFKFQPNFLSLSNKWKSIIVRLLEKKRFKRPNSAALASKLIRKIEE